MKRSYARLTKSLDKLVTIYRHLLELVRKENDVLVRADMNELPGINKSKEKMILKIAELEDKWSEAAASLAKDLKMDTEPRLMELSRKIGGENGEKLQQTHSVLSMLVHRINEINKKNETLVGSALSHINGAINSIADTLNENPTYKNSGGMKEENEGASGRLVQKEV